MIGAMNLCTWTGILASAGFYVVCSTLFSREQIAGTFCVLSIDARSLETRDQLRLRQLPP